MSNDPAMPAADNRLDIHLLPATWTSFPAKSNDMKWLYISQVAIRNINDMVAKGCSESAQELAAHYWRRWREAPTNG